MFPNPKDVTTAQAAVILTELGWPVYPHAIPLGEFFYVPISSGWTFEVASMAYLFLWKRYEEMPLLASLLPEELKQHLTGQTIVTPFGVAQLGKRRLRYAPSLNTDEAKRLTT